jgi:hypothetical protein
MSDSRYVLNPYAARNNRLVKEGFADYRDFLASDEWKKMRGKVLRAFGGKCVRCGAKATQVHHTRYNPGSINGGNLAGLVPVCRPCHEHAEFDGRRKCSLDEANVRLGVQLDRPCTRCHEFKKWASFKMGNSNVCRMCVVKLNVRRRRRSKRKG